MEVSTDHKALLHRMGGVLVLGVMVIVRMMGVMVMRMRLTVVFVMILVWQTHRGNFNDNDAMQYQTSKDSANYKYITATSFRT